MSYTKKLLYRQTTSKRLKYTMHQLESKKNFIKTLVGVVLACLSWLVFIRAIFGIFSIPAIIIGIIALKEIPKNQVNQKNKCFTIGSIVLGTVPLLIFLFFMITLAWMLLFGEQ